MTEHLHLFFFQEYLIVVNGAEEDGVSAEKRPHLPLSAPLYFCAEESGMANMDRDGRPLKGGRQGVSAYYDFFLGGDADDGAVADSSALLRSQIRGHFLSGGGAGLVEIHFDCCFATRLAHSVSESILTALGDRTFICDYTYLFAECLREGLELDGRLRPKQAVAFIGVFGRVCSFWYAASGETVVWNILRLDASWEELATKRLGELIMLYMKTHGSGLGYDPEKETGAYQQDLATCMRVARETLADFRHSRMDLPLGRVMLLNQQRMRIPIMREEQEQAFAPVVYRIANEFMDFLGGKLPAKVYLAGDFTQTNIFPNHVAGFFDGGVVSQLELVELTALLIRGGKNGPSAPAQGQIASPTTTASKTNPMPSYSAAEEIPMRERRKPLKSGRGILIVAFVLFAVVVILVSVILFWTQSARRLSPKPIDTSKINTKKDTGRKVDSLEAKDSPGSGSGETLIAGERNPLYWEGLLRGHMHDKSDLVVSYAIEQAGHCPGADSTLIALMKRQADTAAQFRKSLNLKMEIK